MQANYKKNIFDILTLAAASNIAFTIFLLMFIGHITGNLVLESKIIPGNTFESEFDLTNLKEVTLIFENSKTEWDGYPLYEILDITILGPKGNVVLSQIKEIGFSTTETERPDKPMALIQSSTDTSSFFVPETTGKYHVKISNANFPSSLSISSGMINPAKGPLNYIISLLLWFAVLLVLSINYNRNHEFCYPSKKQVIIALPIGLITAAVALYLSSL
ncbi:Uncharacterised protein [uncultured archaeon]|nr:Uncharacterised protein [uncultured archaeon]